MDIKGRKPVEYLIPVILTALAASIVWTLISISSKPAAEPPEEIILKITPEYSIISNKGVLLWPAGTEFEQGMAAYFYETLPIVNATPKIEISGMNHGLVNGTVKTSVKLQAVDDKFRVYWSYKITEGTQQAFSLSKSVSGQPDRLVYTAAGGSVDVFEAYGLANSINDELALRSAVFQLIISSDITVSGTANQIQIEKSITQELPLLLQQVSFSVPRAKDAVSQVSIGGDEAGTSSRQVLPGILKQNYIPLSVNIALIIPVILLLLKRRIGKPKAAKEHKHFKEWITEGIVEVKGKLAINILSLEGLVDLAIDLDKRVIFDSRIGKYYVLSEDIVYIYDSVRPNLMRESKQQLGKLLLEQGLIQPEQLEVGLHYHERTGARLGESLAALGFIDETTLYGVLAAQHKTDYYELNPHDDFDVSWLDKMSIHQARALIAIPIGKRSDGKLTVACGEFYREEIRKALQEILGTGIHITAARPSAIYEALKRIETNRLEKSTASENITANSERYRRLTSDEAKDFTLSWYRGSIPQMLFLKAAGLVDNEVLDRAHEKEALLSWLANKNIISGETANLIRGLEKASEAMDWKSRQEKKIPGLLDLLLKANYLTDDTKEWVEREAELLGISIEKVIDSNFIAARQTVKNASFLLFTLESILTGL